uniref:Uncharacterized protein n=1 Tax=Ciona intestinalis TaxID=7719 RepID=H2XYD6_CIOIN
MNTNRAFVKLVALTHNKTIGNRHKTSIERPMA